MRLQSLTMLLKVSILITISALQIDGARILFAAFSPSLSHHLFYQPIIKELCARGHEVVSISADPIHQKIENLTEIDIHNETYGSFNVGDYLIYNQQVKPRHARVFSIFGPVFMSMYEAILKNHQVQTLNNQQFDLIIVEYFFPTIFNGWKDYFNCPIIGVSSLDLLGVGAEAFGNPTYPSFFMDVNKLSVRNLDFWQRLENFAYALDMRWWWYSEGMYIGQGLFKKYYNMDLDIKKLQTSVDLVLINSNPIFHLPRPMVPAIIPIGGLHIRERKPLPQDLKQYLDSAKGGVIYFSLGSNVKSKSLPKEKFDAIIGAFNKLPYQIVWKWESNDLPNKPKNVHIQQWLPQQDVLDHPNVKAFVTQGGIQSLEEAIRAKVPMVVMPFGGDQEYNAGRIRELGIGQRLDVDELTTNNLAAKLREILENPLYQTKINKVSDLLWDQPMKPMDKAIWWIEYVIRHKGAEHLRCPAADMSWFKLLSLDVITFLLGSFIVILIAVIFILKFVITLFRNNKVKAE